MPTGDRAIYEMNVRMALGGAQRLGPYSQGFHHPGPAYFYYLAAWYALLGRTTFSLYAGAAMLTLAFVVASGVLVTRWRVAPAASFVFVPLVLLDLGYLGDFPLSDYWPPYVLFLGYALFLLLCGGLASSEQGLLVPALAVGSLLLQTHVSYGIPVLGGGLFVLARLARSGERIPRAALVTVLVTLSVLWAAPVYAEIVEAAGNWPSIVRAFATSESPALSPMRILDRLALEATGVWQYAFFRDSFIVPEAPKHHVAARMIFGVEIFMLALAWWTAKRRAARLPESLCALCLLSVPLGALALHGIHGTVAPHHTAWLSSLGLVSNLAAMAGLLPSASPGGRLDRVETRRFLVAAAFLVAWVGRPPRLMPELHRNEAVEPLVRAIAGHARSLPGPVRLEWGAREERNGAGPAFEWATGIMLELSKAGVDVVVQEQTPLRWVLGRSPWTIADGQEPEVSIAASPPADDMHALACVTHGDNPLMTYPVCAWAAEP